MRKEDCIYVAGHKGLVGSAISRLLVNNGFHNILTRPHSQLDLSNQSDTLDFFNKEKPDYVFLSAAKVGGIHANERYPAEFAFSNLMIQSNVIHSAYLNNVKALLFLGSSCIYPKLVSQPISESAILSAALEQTNEPYAVAKIAGIKLCESYNRQYGTDFRSAMPSNLYGENDNFTLNDSHVIPSLIRRFHEAKVNNLSQVKVWGTGKVRREFLHVDDMADASIFIMNLDKQVYKSKTKPMLSHINVGIGEDISINSLAMLIKKIVGYKGKILFDSSKPDGTPQKLLDTTLLSSFGWSYNTELEVGLKKTYDWFLTNFDLVRK
jgi:GDP-L-fucose synthase